MFGLGGGEILVIVVVALLVFGPSKLPQIARAIKTAYQEFRKLNQQVSKTVNEIRQDIDLNIDLGLEDDSGSRVKATSKADNTTSIHSDNRAGNHSSVPQLRVPEGERVGLRPPEPSPVRELDNPLPVASADDYLAPTPAIPNAAEGADDYLSGGAA